jgi:hypothetical protein
MGNLLVPVSTSMGMDLGHTWHVDGQHVNVVNSTKTLEFIPIFLDFFQSIYALVSDHVTLAFILAKVAALVSAKTPEFLLSFSYQLLSVIAQSLLSCRTIVPSTFLLYWASMV